MQAVTLSEDTVFVVYQLMLGGIDETQPLRLAALAGVSAFDLSRFNLANLFNFAHRKWGGLSWASPDEPVFVNPPQLEPLAVAKCGERLVCDNCGRITAVVPCATCPHDTPPKWVTRRDRRHVLPQMQGAVEQMLAEFRDPHLSAIDFESQPLSAIQYHGNPQDDT